jgi:predicted ester cyclase
MKMNDAELRAFAARYAAAWCSGSCDQVAEHFSPNGWLRINGGEAAKGRKAIAVSAQEFMTAFPDLQVSLNDLISKGDGAEFHWTLVGNNTGPGGTGRNVRISGFEVWKMGEDGLIAESEGHFDAADYQRQIEGRT